MTNKERAEKRYQNRQAKRQLNKEKRMEKIPSLDEIFSIHSLFKNGKLCCKNLRWKQSTQNFERHLLSVSATIRNKILSATWTPRDTHSFVLSERGKIRNIDAPHIQDRLVHKVLVREVLIPLYYPYMIVDNAASRVGGGIDFQFKRLKQHLQKHFKKYGRNGVVIQIDLKGFFPNANKTLIYAQHEKYVKDERIRNFLNYIVSKMPETSPGRGMAIGMELSQIEMTFLPSFIDQWLKCQKHIATCGHYMDDYYIIYPDEQEARKLGNEICQKFINAGIPVNAKKCKIVPLDKPFKFCKATFRLTKTGGIKVNKCRDGAKRIRRKLKLFKKEMLEGKKTFKEIKQYFHSVITYYKKYNDHGRVLRLNRLFYALFKDEIEAERSINACSEDY